MFSSHNICLFFIAKFLGWLNRNSHLVCALKVVIKAKLICIYTKLRRNEAKTLQFHNDDGRICNPVLLIFPIVDHVVVLVGVTVVDFIHQNYLHKNIQLYLRQGMKKLSYQSKLCCFLVRCIESRYRGIEV